MGLLSQSSLHAMYHVTCHVTCINILILTSYQGALGNLPFLADTGTFTVMLIDVQCLWKKKTTNKEDAVYV